MALSEHLPEDRLLGAGAFLSASSREGQLDKVQVDRGSLVAVDASSFVELAHYSGEKVPYKEREREKERKRALYADSH